MFKITRRGLLLGATALTAAGLVPLRSSYAQARRTNHALLVAVTKYPNLPEKTWLVGPNHDAVLVRDYLTAKAGFEPGNVTLLADDLEGAVGSPTNSAIKEQFAALAKRVEAEAAAGGEAFVYIHMSGHGANQPQRKQGDETDRLDEIFLPADTMMCKDIKDGLPNALVDDDIRASLDAIRATGAFVWIVFDCCHSGSATRAVESAADLMSVDRKVEFLEVVDPSIKEEAAAAMLAADASGGNRGIGEDGERAPAFQVVPTGADSIAKGGMVAFYAAQTIETTPEMPLPKGAPDATRYGLFTYTIISKLSEVENKRVTYRQLGHAVLQQYSADGRPRPTPLFEGVLDAPVFGTEKIETEQQWPITVGAASATVPAGTLHRLAPGAKLAILPDPLSEMSEAVGYVEVANAKNLLSTVIPVEFDGKPALKLADIPKNAYARVAELAVDYKLVVARPGPSEGLEAEVALVNKVIDELAADPEARFRIQLVEHGAEADLRFAVEREDKITNAAMDASDKPALWFLPASGDVSKTGNRPPLVGIDVTNPEKLKKGTGDNLLTIYRATSLSRLAATSDYKPTEVTVEFRILRADTGNEDALVEAKVPFVKPGDQVHVAAKNLSSKLVDINVLYIGSDYSISHMTAQRLEKNSEINEGLLEITDSSFGMERMIAVLTEAPPQSEIEDLSFLQQAGVPPVTRKVGGAAGFSDMLRDIGLAPATRAAMKLGDKGGNKGAVMIFPMETVPRS